MASQKRKVAKRKPITEHQLFPAVVALWFGALFGLGSLAIRPSLLESLVIKSRIDLVIPAAAPPLGITARILIALLMAAAGAVLGIILARRIARPRPAEHQRKRGPGASAEAAQPRETANAAPAGKAAAGRSRRRALAIDPEESEFQPHEFAPLPGGAPQVLDIAGMDLGSSDAVIEQASAAPEEASPEPAGAPLPSLAVAEFSDAEYTPLDLGDFAEPEPAEAPAFAVPAANQPTTFAVPASAPFAAPVSDFAAPVPSAPAPSAPVPSAPIIAPFAAPSADTQPPVVAPGLQAFAAPIAAAEPAPAPLPSPALAELPVLAEPDARRPAELAMDELAVRLAQSMQRRRARTSNAPAPQDEPVAAAAAATEQSIPQAEPATTVPVFTAPAAPAAPFAAPAVSAETASAFSTEHALPRFDTPQPAPTPMEPPAAMRPLSFDHLDGHDDDSLDDLLPPRSIAMPQPVQPVVEAPAPQAGFSAPALASAPADEGSEAADAPYASLLDVELGSAPRSSFVRVEEPEDRAEAVEPVVIFPGRTARAGTAPFEAPSTANGETAPMGAAPLAAASEAVPFRRFDPPPAPGQSRPVVAAAADPALDPAETERALRAALANLQRMSGAA